MDCTPPPRLKRIHEDASSPLAGARTTETIDGQVLENAGAPYAALVRDVDLPRKAAVEKEKSAQPFHRFDRASEPGDRPETDHRWGR